VKDLLTRRQARSALTAQTWPVLRLRLRALRRVVHPAGWALWATHLSIQGGLADVQPSRGTRRTSPAVVPDAVSWCYGPAGTGAGPSPASSSASPTSAPSNSAKPGPPSQTGPARAHFLGPQGLGTVRAPTASIGMQRVKPARYPVPVPDRPAGRESAHVRRYLSGRVCHGPALHCGPSIMSGGSMITRVMCGGGRSRKACIRSYTTVRTRRRQRSG
jgi:hypothetical protein